MASCRVSIPVTKPIPRTRRLHGANPGAGLRLVFVLGLAISVQGRSIAADDPVAGPPSAAEVEAKLDELLQPTLPKSPDEALAAFEVVPGFRIELVASEPLVNDPVAGAFDERGRLYVAELTDYPFRPREGEAPLGVVHLLEDRNGDGRFDRSTVFADELLWPSGIVCWQGGIFVAAAPHIYYLRDNDGDGRADMRRVVFSGFGIQNEQGAVNNLSWGLDGLIYGCTSMNGGEIGAAQGKQRQRVSVAGSDFRFDPWRCTDLLPELAPVADESSAGIDEAARMLATFEPLSGNSQFGMAHDAWGERFLCSESTPCRHVVLPRNYLVRNPTLEVPTTIQSMVSGVTPIFRISPLEGWRVVRSARRLSSEERSGSSAGASHHVLDGVAGPTIYEGHAFPAEMRGELFVGDAQNNLVHRRKLIPRGVTFTSERIDQNTEFLRSSDNWFRPVNTMNAPDGALWIFDFYRMQVESVHVPLDVWRRVDLTAGRDRGRIWRVVPEGFVSPPLPGIDRAPTADLVALLEHENIWWRQTAQRLLTQRADPNAVPLLAQLAQSSTVAHARVHALYTLARLGGLKTTDVLAGLHDIQPQVRRHALVLAEPWLAPLEDPLVLDRVLALSRDDDPRVRFQTALCLGQLYGSAVAQGQAVDALAQLIVNDIDDYWLRTAVLSSSNRWSLPLVRRLVDDRKFASHPLASAVLNPLAHSIGRQGGTAGADALLGCLAYAIDANAAPPWTAPAIVELARGLDSSGSRLADVLGSLGPAARGLLDSQFAGAMLVARSVESSPAQRAQAAALLGCQQTDEAHAALAALLESQADTSVVKAVLAALGRYDSPATVDAILAHWSTFLPESRDAAIRVLFSREPWLEVLVGALERGEVSSSQIPAALWSTLVEHRNDAIAERAARLLDARDAARADVIERYAEALKLPGDAALGVEIYRRECMSCHRMQNEGFDVGPNLALVRNRTKQELLAHVLDPNREVQPAYAQYVAVDLQGGVHTGILAADAATSVTLRREKGLEETLLKADLDEWRGTDRSLMPEGFEKTISIAEMGNLLAFLDQTRYDRGTDPGHEEPTGDAP